MSKIQFRNAAHRDFVLENLDKCKVNDCYHRAFFYVMGISEETRMNIGKMFDFKRDCIIPEGMHGGWQTSGTVKVCHLAFNLWNGFTEEGRENLYTPEELFCCGYVAHVLRYYPYGRAFTAGGNQAIVEVALTQVGNQGGQPYWSWYGFNSRVEWCACFVSWCADQCGYIESGLVPKFAGCVDGANWFKSNGKWQDRTYEPKAGDIIFFDWEGDGTTDHVGIVEKCENGTVYTVEGNSGDACKQRQYAVGSSNIYGYGIPAY